MRNLYIDFDGVILDTLPPVYKLAKQLNLDYKTQTKEMSKLFSKIDWEELIDDSVALNDSVNAIKKLSESGKFNISILTHVNSLKEAKAKIKFLDGITNDLTIIPIINKIDLPNAEVDRVKKEIIENILIFIPLGLLLKMKDLSSQKIFLLGFLLSFTYEFLQYIFSIGVADITDIITNAIGAILGSLVYSILSHFIHNKSKLNNFIITSGYLVFTIFIALFALLNIVN